MIQTPPAVALIGCGPLFEDIAANWRLLCEGRELHLLQLENTDHAAQDTAALLAGHDPSRTRIFAAVGSQAVNHARLDVYGRARMMGFRAESLRHPSAVVAGDVRIGENCWIGAGAVIAHGVQIGNNTIIGDAARIEAGARLGANTWIGAGASVGAKTVLGQNCLIGHDVRMGAGLQIGRHCVVDVPGSYAESLPMGVFIDPLFPLPVRIYGGAQGM